MPREGSCGGLVALARECGDVWSTAWALHLLGRVAYFDGDADTARFAGLRKSGDRARDRGPLAGGLALHLLGLAAHIEADYSSARQLYEESLLIRRELDFPGGDRHHFAPPGDGRLRPGRLSFGVVAVQREPGDDAVAGSHWLIGNLLANFAASPPRS